MSAVAEPRMQATANGWGKLARILATIDIDAGRPS